MLAQAVGSLDVLRLPWASAYSIVESLLAVRQVITLGWPREQLQSFVDRKAFKKCLLGEVLP